MRETASNNCGCLCVHHGLRYEAAPIACLIVVSCFNGIGGSFRTYDVLGVQAMGRISIDVIKTGNRLTRCTWPGVDEYDDINKITRDDVLCWANDFACAEKHTSGGGFALSSVRAFRENLAGERSNPS